MKSVIQTRAFGLCALMGLTFAFQAGCSEGQAPAQEQPIVEAQESVREDPSPSPDALPQELMETARPEEFPDTVARVNGTEITRQALLGSLEAIRGRMRLPAGDLPIDVYQSVLGQLVDFELLFQASKSLNLAASSEVVNAQFEEIRSRFPSEEAFSSELATQEMTPELLKENLRRDLSVQALIETEYAGRLTVTDQAKQRFYEEHKAEMTEPESLNVAHILVKVDESASEEDRLQARRKIDRVRQQAGEGSDFGELARQNSDDPGSKDAGGQMTITRGQTVPEFEAAAYALEQDGISEVVETRFGFHIIKLLGRTPARTASYQEAEATIQQFLEQQELRDLIQSELEAMRSEASIELFI